MHFHSVLKILILQCKRRSKVTMCNILGVFSIKIETCEFCEDMQIVMFINIVLRDCESCEKSRLKKL